MKYKLLIFPLVMIMILGFFNDSMEFILNGFDTPLRDYGKPKHPDLHGTNADVGGFQIKGSVSKNKNGDVTYDLNYTWNDKIDPNFIYESDSKKAEYAKSIPFANPTDYTIRITWTDKTIIRAKQTWYSWDSGWLK